MSTNLECPLEFGVHLWATVPIEYSFPFLVATIFDFRESVSGREGGRGNTKHWPPCLRGNTYR